MRDGLWRTVGYSSAIVEFSYNNSYHASIEMAPYEALYEENVDHLYVGKLVRDN